MTTADPISLSQAKRLAANADTIRLRATRAADLETPIGAFLRLDTGDPAYLLESVEGGERLGRYSFLGIGPRRLLEVRDGLARIQTRPVTVPAYSPDLPVDTIDAPDPLDAIRAFVRRRRVEPTEGMPRFTGGAVGAISYDAVSAFEPTVPLPDRDPIGVPTAAFIETDLVLVFDHLTHTLSAIASLHTEAPDFEGRYKIAEAAIFEALERTARPSPAEMAGSGPRPAAAAAAASGEPGAAPPPPPGEAAAPPAEEGTVPANDPGLQLPEESAGPPPPSASPPAGPGAAPPAGPAPGAVVPQPSVPPPGGAPAATQPMGP